MKKIIVVFIFVVLGALTSNAQVIKFDETVHNFGEIEDGRYAKTEFVFKNTGDKPLVLKNVKPSCGCTSPTWTKDPIQPGKKGTIKIVFNSRGYAGRNFQKSIIVNTNMKKDAVKVLIIKGKVLPKGKKPLVSSPVQIN